MTITQAQFDDIADALADVRAKLDAARIEANAALNSANLAALSADDARRHAATARASANNAATLAANAGTGITYVLDLVNGDPDPDPDPEPGERPTHPGPDATEDQVLIWAQELDAWIDDAVGPRGELIPVGAGVLTVLTSSITGHVWSGNRLNVWPTNPDGAIHLEGIDIDGLIYVADSTRHLELVDVRCRGIQFANNPNCTVAIDHCDIGDSPDGVALGQGAVNMWGQTGWEIRRTRLHGFADGIQCIGDGLLAECLIEDLRYADTTHNDFVQNYGSGVVLEGCVLRGRPPFDYHLNGVFQSTSTAVNTLDECVVTVRGDHRFRNWAGHSNPSKNTHATLWASSYIEGILIGNHNIGAGTVHRGPAMTEAQAAAISTRVAKQDPSGPGAALPSGAWNEAW